MLSTGQFLEPLPAEIQQFVEHLLDGGDYAGVAALLGGGGNDESIRLADVGVGKLDGSRRRSTRARCAGVSLNGQSAVVALGEVVVADLHQPTGLVKRAIRIWPRSRETPLEKTPRMAPLRR